MLGLMSILLVSLVLGVLLLNTNESSKRKKIYLVIVFGIMFFYSALRGENVGIDTYNYKLAFYEIKSYGLWQALSFVRYERGYILANYILGIFFKDAQVVLVITSLFIAYNFASCIYKYSENVVISTFLYIMYFFSSTMNISRQYIALGFIMISFKYLLTKKTIKAAILIGIAVLFHNTAIIFIPFLVLTMPKFKINLKTILLFCVTSVILLFSFEKILNLFFRIFPAYARFMDSTIYSAESKLSIPWLVFYIFVLICSIIVVMQGGKTDKLSIMREGNDDDSCFIKVHKEKINLESFGLFILLYIAFIVCFIFSNKLWIGSRMLAYFKPALCFIIPNTVEHLTSKKPIFKYIIYIIFIAIFFNWAHSMFLLDPHGLLPYSFFWN